MRIPAWAACKVLDNKLFMNVDLHETHAMPESDRELIQRAKQLLGGNQKALAQGLAVTPSAISNWLAANRIPEASRAKVVTFLEQLTRNQPAGAASEAARAPAPSSEDFNRPDVQHCGFLAESAWCFNYLVPSPTADEPADDEVWRTWKGVHAIRSTTFRHYFRYLPHDGKNRDKRHDSARKHEQRRASAKGSASKAHPANEDLRGFGFLKNWSPPSWDHAQIHNAHIEYLDASAELTPGDHGCGGYFIRAHRSVMSRAEGTTTYEFVGFRSECPVKEMHLVLSLPRELRGAGPMVAYLMSTDYPQYYDFASRISTNQGELDRLIEPWGRVVPVDRLRPEQLLEWGKSDAWAAGWGAADQDTVRKISDSFQSEPGRDVSVATIANPPPLTTLLMFWPLPQRG